MRYIRPLGLPVLLIKFGQDFQRGCAMRMGGIKRWFVSGVWLGSFFLCQVSQGALTWRVDFNGSSGDTLSTSNFTGWTVSGTSRTQSFVNVDGGVISSNISVRLIGGGTWSTYERTVSSSAATNLYRDGAQTTVSGITVSMTNLTPGVSYGVRLWYFDNNYSIGTTQTYVNVTDGSSVNLGSLTNRGSAQLPSSLYDSRYSLYAEITAGSGGSIDVTVTPSSGNTKVTALEMTALGDPPAILNYSGAVFNEADANNGTVTNMLTLTLSGDAFTGGNGDDYIALGKASAGNVPSGLTAVLTRQSSSAAVLSLTGTASAHAAANSINNMSLVFANSAFTLNQATNITGYSRTDLAVTFSDPLVRSLSYDSTTFTEAPADNGSIQNTLTISLANETFTGSNGDDLIALGKASAGNVPSGLTAVLTRQSASAAVLSLTGQAAAHAATNSISNLSLTFANTAFAGGEASGVTGYSRSDISVNYNGLLIEGPVDGVFLAWSSYPGATYRIEVSTNLTAAGGGFIPVVTNIPATPAYNRRYVAPTGADTEFYRVVRE